MKTTDDIIDEYAFCDKYLGYCKLDDKHKNKKWFSEEEIRSILSETQLSIRKKAYKYILKELFGELE